MRRTYDRGTNQRSCMSAIRILYVDDEPDLREIVQISLGLDPEFTVRSCSCGREAVAAAAEWLPDLILLDVIMPDMDGPATLARLRESAKTNGIPVIFMTARAQQHELEHFLALGADGIIPKPFDPLTLAAHVREQMHTPRFRLAGPRARFFSNVRAQATALRRDRDRLSDHDHATLDWIISVAHKIAGGAGTVGYREIGSRALALEQVAVELRYGSGTVARVQAAIDSLVALVEPSETP
ncbi:MAG TPA: response regulator [Xanthobacteraceae bacterium]|nr:response regulator [Xanthobacteraceae bacterium]